MDSHKALNEMPQELIAHIVVVSKDSSFSLAWCFLLMTLAKISSSQHSRARRIYAVHGRVWPILEIRFTACSNATDVQANSAIRQVLARCRVRPCPAAWIWPSKI